MNGSSVQTVLDQAVGDGAAPGFVGIAVRGDDIFPSCVASGHAPPVRYVTAFQAQELRNERMLQQNQGIAEELQRSRAAKTREEVEVL